MSILHRLRTFVRRSGFDVIRYNARSSPVARREQLFARYGLSLVFDVGANDGGYARELRKHGYRGRIVSLEPLASAYARLEAAARHDDAWEVVHAALGTEAGTATLHVAANSESSSLLEMTPRHTAAYPESAYVREETITVKTLDEVFPAYYRPGDAVLLKIDTQGYEAHVLDGGRRVLDRVAGIQLEMSLVPLYEGERRLPGMVTLLEDLGYVLMSIEPVIEDPATGQLLQVDGLFFRAP